MMQTKTDAQLAASLRAGRRSLEGKRVPSSFHGIVAKRNRWLLEEPAVLAKAVARCRAADARRAGEVAR